MSALEKFTNLVLNNPLSKAIGRAVEATAEWVGNPPHVRAMLKASRILKAAESGDVEAVKKALKKQGKLDYKNDTFVKMLVGTASAHGQEEVLQMLLDRGASPVAEDWRGVEPAEAALLAGHLSVVELLYKHVNDKGLPPTDKLKNAFSLAQEVRAKERGNNPDAGKPVSPPPAKPS